MALELVNFFGWVVSGWLASPTSQENGLQTTFYRAQAQIALRKNGDFPSGLVVRNDWR